MSFQYATGGTLAPGAPSYVERCADRELLSHLQSGETCYVLNSRQMGKSSLCVRTIGKLKEQGFRTVFLDLTKFGGRNLTAEQWYAALLSEIGRDLGLRNEFLAFWKENAGLPPVQRLFGAITELGLRDGASVVVFIDEIDVTLSLPFSADEFFAAIRQCYVGRATDERLKKLSFCLLGTATPADLIQDTRVSPFNIGRRIELGDFTAAEAAPLGSGLGDPALLARVLHWTGGHPYLTQRLCQAVRDSETKNVDQVCSDLFLTHAAKDSDDNLAFVRNRLLKSEADLAALLDLYRKLRTGKRVPDDETNPLCAILKLSGVARVEAGRLKVRNRIYEHVFDRGWVETHVPDAEKRRQREAYRKGVLRTASVGAAVLAMMAILVYNLYSARNTALATQKELDYQLYVSKMNNLQIFYEEGDITQLSKILEETKSNPYRGWEWGYWQSLIQDSNEQYALESDADPLQYALLTHDAKHIMFVDRSIDRAILVDRKTERMVANYSIAKNEYLQRLGPEWVACADTGNSMVIRDLLSGKIRFSHAIESGSQAYVTAPAKSSSVLLIHQYSALSRSSIMVDARTGKVLWATPSRGRDSNSFVTSCSANGGRVLIVNPGPPPSMTSTYIVQDRDGRVLDRLMSDEGGVTALMSPSGRYWVHGSGEQLILRDLSSLSKQQTIVPGKHGRFRAVDFDCSEGKLILTTEKDRAVVWSISQSKELAVYHGVGMIVDVSMATNEMLCSTDIFRVVSLTSQSRKEELVSYVSRGIGDLIVVQGLDSLRLVSDPALKVLRRIELKGGGLAASWNGRVYATFESSKGGKESVLRETESGKVLTRSKLGWYCVDASDSKDLFATVTADNRLAEVFRFGSDDALWKKAAGAGDRIYQASMSPDGKLLLLSTMSSVTAYDAQTGKPQSSVTGDYLTSGFVHGTTDYWISLGRTLKVFDSDSFNQIFELPTEWNIIRVMQSPDKRRIVTSGGSREGSTIWDKTTRQRLCRIPSFEAGCFTRDGKTLVGIRDGRLTAITMGSTAPITRIHFNASASSQPESP